MGAWRQCNILTSSGHTDVTAAAVKGSRLRGIKSHQSLTTFFELWKRKKYTEVEQEQSQVFVQDLPIISMSNHYWLKLHFLQQFGVQFQLF